MKRMIGIDSNALTYFVEALLTRDDPEKDSSDIAEERIAMVRIYFYTGETYYVLPTVEVEYKRIHNKLTKEQHKLVCLVLLLDYNWNLNAIELEERTQELLAHHTGDKDCQIVAEAELAGLKILLTCDAELKRCLASRTKNLAIFSPKEYWDSLEIPRGAKPILQPLRSSPLSHEKWWKW